MEKFSKNEDKHGIVNLPEKHIVEMQKFIPLVFERFSKFIHVYAQPKGILKVLTVVLMLQGGKLIAQETIDNRSIKNDPTDPTEMDGLVNLEIEQIMEKVRFSEIPPNVSFSRKMEEKAHFENGSRSADSKSNVAYGGDAPRDTGLIGDMGIYASECLVEKQENNDSSDMHWRSYSSDIKLFQSQIEESSVEVKKEIEMKEIGSTKEDAVFNALQKINDYFKMHVKAGTFMSTSGSSDSEVGFSRRMIDFASKNAMNFFKNLRVEKIEESKKDGKVVFTATISGTYMQTK